MAAYDLESEPPLDPAAERLRRRLVRLLLVSGLIMMLGFIAVFAAIVHKLGSWAGAPAADMGSMPTEARIAIPPGSRLVSTTLDADRALLHLENGAGEATLLLVDLASGRVLGRYALETD